MSKAAEGKGQRDVSASTTATAEQAPRRRSAPPSRHLGLVMLHPSRGRAAAQSFEVRGERWLGRSRDAPIRLEDAHVSRRHARVTPRADGVVVTDESSRHGTFVNGVRVGAVPALARFGDVLRVGDVLLLVVADVERFAAPPRRTEGMRLGLKGTLLAGPELAEVWDEALRVASLSEPVLVLGESGSGKECVARLLQYERAEAGPFVGVNASALRDGLFDSELFGVERGAFPGATAARHGAFREASGGTLFLDDVSELTLENQAKLLRALDTGAVRALGSTADVAVDARVVTATDKDLERECDAGQFRSDLYYRLSGLVLRVPPLRERRSDVLLIAEEVLGECTRGMTLSASAAERLATAEWRGNARELRHAVTSAAQRAAARGDARVLSEDLPSLTTAETETLTVDRIERALSDCGGVVSHAAKMLGVSRTTFYKAIKRFETDRPLPGDTNGSALGTEHQNP